MNWHTGNIAEAVAESKAKDAIFVVYIEGQDEMSAKLDGFLSNSRVCSKMMTCDFVAVKVQADSPTYSQFSSLYKVVPVPSIFFIGKSGTPLDVTTGIIASVEELLVKIDKVLLLAGKQTHPVASGSGNTVATERSIAGADESLPTMEQQETAAAELAIISEQKNSSEAVTSEVIDAPKEAQAIANSNDLAQKASTSGVLSDTAAAPTVTAPVETASAPAVPAPAPATTVTTPAVPVPAVPEVAAATASQANSSSRPSTIDAEIQQLLEKKRLEREEEQKRLEKENELRRRREGREAQVQQTQAREQELKNMQERIRRERQQEQEARERILAQIAADRAELAANRADEKSNNTITTSTLSMSDSLVNTSADETRLQIRLPGGITRTKSFAVQESLSTVRVYVLNELLAGSNIRDFTLATSYPRREFKVEEEDKTLMDLNLVPNAVLLVIKREQVNSVVRTSTSIYNILSSVLWAILTPATMAFDYLNKIGFQRIRQRLMQMVSNVGLVKSGPSTGTGRAVASNMPNSAQDASSRRNMGLFEGGLHQSRQSPGMPDSTSDDATSTQSGDTQQQSPTMIFSEGNIQQQAATQRAGGAYRRYGEPNIRRLADTTKDEDDKATYNGNSTQQQ